MLANLRERRSYMKKKAHFGHILWTFLTSPFLLPSFPAGQNFHRSPVFFRKGLSKYVEMILFRYYNFLQNTCKMNIWSEVSFI